MNTIAAKFAQPVPDRRSLMVPPRSEATYPITSPVGGKLGVGPPGVLTSVARVLEGAERRV
jgi:hypothetical protein